MARASAGSISERRSVTAPACSHRCCESASTRPRTSHTDCFISGTTVSYSAVAVRGVGGATGPARAEGAVVTEYLIYFNQQWVGDHTEEWFRRRGPLARAVMDEMKAAGVYVFAGGLEEEDGP